MSKANKDFAGDLIGLCFPRDEVAADGRRLRRRWTVRTARTLPSQAALDSVSLSVSRKIVGLWKEALGNVVSAERLVAASPDVSVRKIAAYHCVVTIESQASEYALGDDQAIVTYGALLEFDREFEILDLAGLPRECWFFLANRVGDEA